MITQDPCIALVLLFQSYFIDAGAGNELISMRNVHIQWEEIVPSDFIDVDGWKNRCLQREEFDWDETFHEGKVDQVKIKSIKCHTCTDGGSHYGHICFLIYF